MRGGEGRGEGGGKEEIRILGPGIWLRDRNTGLRILLDLAKDESAKDEGRGLR